MNRLLLLLLPCILLPPVALCIFFFFASVSVSSDFTEYKHEDREPTQLEKQTFDILKKSSQAGC